MVPKLHAKGSSFRGIAAYLLHDKDRALTAERIAWTETRNLATENPNVAWKVMAATAMDQGRLKEQAGVKKTGRKSRDAVLHFTLSWHPEEREGLTREEMMRAANQAIRALGASDRQALIVHHIDEPQPHIHIVVNRVSMEDGRMLSSSKEKLALSQWAEAYEKERGIVYCDARVVNNEARKRGEKDTARHIYELEAANDNTPGSEAVREMQRRKDAALEKAAREKKERDRQKWDELQQAHKTRVKEIRAQAKFDREAARNAVREKYKSQWIMRHHERQAETRDFEIREKTFLGRFKNILGAVDLKAIIQGRIEGQERTRRQALTEPFKALSDAGVRYQGVKRKLDAADTELQKRQRLEEAEAVRKVVAAREDDLVKNRVFFDKQRNDLILRQSLEGAKLRAERKVRNQDRERAWSEVRDVQTGDRHLPQLERDFAAEAFLERRKEGRERDKDRER